MMPIPSRRLVQASAALTVELISSCGRESYGRSSSVSSGDFPVDTLRRARSVSSLA